MARANAYAPPTPLEDLHILDYLELAGSQAKAGAVLAMHQSTVCRSLLDGALVSSFSLAKLLLPGQEPRWDGLAALPLGQLTLQLVASDPQTRRVLLPRKGAAPLLHQTLAWHGFALEKQPAACQEPAAWVKRARDRKLAMPICPQLLGQSWLEGNGLAPLAEQPALVEQLWLLLPRGAVDSRAARQCLRLLRAQVGRVQTMQDPHGLQC